MDPAHSGSSIPDSQVRHEIVSIFSTTFADSQGSGIASIGNGYVPAVRAEAPEIYAWLPARLLVLKNIERSSAMSRTGRRHRALMPTLAARRSFWRESGPYDAYGPEMLLITDRPRTDMPMATNET